LGIDRRVAAGVGAALGARDGTSPGWRDDDLIELFTLLAAHPERRAVVYFAGASGHEPLYHTVRGAAAGVAG
jgi:hypothetical protein